MGPAIYERYLPHIEAVLTGQRVTFELQIPTKGGSTRYAKALYIPDVDDTGKIKGFVSLKLDMTEKKMNESALQYQTHITKVRILNGTDNE